MEKAALSILFKMIGIGSASGLLYHDNTIFAIGDNSTYWYEYQMESNTLKRHPLVEHPKEDAPKISKPDFESITQHQDHIYIFGSGSRENRTTMIEVDLKSKKVISENDLSNLYHALQSFGTIKPEDFNIEGVICDGKRWFFFNRGNGKTNKNIVFTVAGKNWKNDFRILSNTYLLPKIKGVETGFTDAILVEDKIYFLAAAENTKSTFDDGEIMGSLVGRIDVKSMQLDFTEIISDIHKLEGIALFKKSEKELEFLLCEDNDTEALESNIYKLKLNNI